MEQEKEVSVKVDDMYILIIIICWCFFLLFGYLTYYGYTDYVSGGIPGGRQIPRDPVAFTPLIFTVPFSLAIGFFTTIACIRWKELCDSAKKHFSPGIYISTCIFAIIIYVICGIITFEGFRIFIKGIGANNASVGGFIVFIFISVQPFLVFGFVFRSAFRGYKMAARRLRPV